MPIDRAYAFIELSALHEPLSEIGYRVEVDDPSATLRIERPGAGAESTLNIGLEPSPADDIRLVSCDAVYRYETAEGAVAEVTAALPIITRHMPVGHLALDLDGRVHARWTIATDSRQSLDDEHIITSIVMFDLLQQHFGDYVEEVCNGDIPAALVEQLMRQAGDIDDG